MRLLAGRQMNAGEPAGNREFEGGNMNLRQVQVQDAAPVSAGHGRLLDDRQVQFRSQRSIDTTLLSSRVHERGEQPDVKSGPRPVSWSETGIKPDLNIQCRASDHE